MQLRRGRTIPDERNQQDHKSVVGVEAQIVDRWGAQIRRLL